MTQRIPVFRKDQHLRFLADLDTESLASMTARTRPILFSRDMVTALRANLKTQTRRLRGLDNINAEPDAWEYLGAFDGEVSASVKPEWHRFRQLETGEIFQVRCPYGIGGDRLWCRETTKSYLLPNILEDPGEALCGRYAADNAPVLTEDGFDIAWWYTRPSCPSIHMPRYASRDTLEVISATPERLHAITRDDALAEGIIYNPSVVVQNGRIPALYSHGTTDGYPTAKDAFHALWDKINGAGEWAKNKWCWRVEFKRMTA